MQRQLTIENAAIRAQAKKSYSYLHLFFLAVSTIGSTIYLYSFFERILAETFAPFVDLSNLIGFWGGVFKFFCFVFAFCVALLCDFVLFSKHSRVAFSELFILCKVLFARDMVNMFASRGIAHNVITRFFAGFGIARLLQMCLSFFIATTGFTVSFITSYGGSDVTATTIRPKEEAKENRLEVTQINSRRDAEYKKVVGPAEEKLAELRKEASKGVSVGKQIEKMAKNGNGWAQSKIDSAQKAAAKFLAPQLALAEKELSDKILYFNDKIAPAYDAEIAAQQNSLGISDRIWAGLGFLIMLFGVGALLFCLMIEVVTCLDIVTNQQPVQINPAPVSIQTKTAEKAKPSAGTKHNPTANPN